MRKNTVTATFCGNHGAFYLSYFFNSSSRLKNISFHSGASLKISSSISLIWFNPT